MAAEVSTMPGINGYAPHQGYGGIDQQQQNNHSAYNQNIATSQAAFSQPPPATSTPGTTGSSQPEISKDEVGWYFVEQYYTTLSRSPEKLYLFYNKRSQLVSGQETEKVDVCVGQRAINDKIKELDFQDCKVRVTNVDSQASDSNIVIQVIGEISNKSQPHKKFTQTFVLATQTNGYFVLNDIFRYLIEEEEEQQPEQQEAAAPAQEQEEVIQTAPAVQSGNQEPVPSASEEAEPKTLTSSMDPLAVEHDANQVDKELEDKVLKTEEPLTAVVNGDSTPEPEQVAEAEEAPAAAVASEEEQPAATTEPTEPLQPTTTAEADLQPEKPKDPSPSPVATPAQQAPPQPAAPPKPAAPKTWASLAASAHRVATPAAPTTQSQSRPQQPAAKPAVQTPTPAAAASPAQSQSTPPTAPAAQREQPATPATDAQDEWTAVGGSHGRQQSRAANTQQQEQGPQSRGYIKNVHEGIEFQDLKAQLEKFGETTYFDIARQKVS